jgi:hypothetical protein
MVAASDAEEELPSGNCVDLDDGELGGSPILPESLVGDLPALGGRGGRLPLPRPFRILRVSVKRWYARSCCPRETSVNALVNMSEVSNSIRR